MENKTGKLFKGQMLMPEDTLVSIGGRARLHYQVQDGNLVSYWDGNPHWASHTEGHSAGSLKMRSDGDLVLTDKEGRSFAHTRTGGHPGAMVQLNDDGNFVVYEDPRGPLAGTPIWASATMPFVVEDVAPEPVPQRPTRPLVGRVNLIDGGRGGIGDDLGRLLVVGLHAGSLLAEVKHRGDAVVAPVYDYAQSRGFHVMRTWTDLPAPEWWGVPPRPGTFIGRDNEEIIRNHARALIAHELRWLVSLGDFMWLYPGNKAKLCEYMTWLGHVLQQEGGADKLVFGFDAGNEAWNFTRCEDPTLMGAMLDAFQKECPCPLRSMTSARDEGTLNQFDGPPVTITDKHGSRGEIRHALEYSFTVGYWDGKTHAYTFDSETPGCGPKVSATDHPEQWMEPESMGAMVLMSLFARQTPFVMSSPGVYLSNETFEMYDAQLSLAPKIAALLPQDIQSWQLFHGGPDRPFTKDQILHAPEKPGNFRCEHARGPNNQYGVMVYQDAPGPLSIEAINGFEGTIMDPGTLEAHPISFGKGEKVSLDFRRARFLLGKRTT